jgi:hypothetical protein
MQNFTLRIAALLLLLISFSCHFKDKVDLSSIEGILRHSLQEPDSLLDKTSQILQ